MGSCHFLNEEARNHPPPVELDDTTIAAEFDPTCSLAERSLTDLSFASFWSFVVSSQFVIVCFNNTLKLKCNLDIRTCVLYNVNIVM